MSWDRKARGSPTGYYYASERTGGRSVKRYVGRGRAAMQAAAEVKQRRHERQAAARHRLRVEAAVYALRGLCELVLLLARAELLLCGYHQHDGSTWRKRRVPRQER